MLLTQSVYATDSTKVKKIKVKTETTEVEKTKEQKAEKAEKEAKAPKTEKEPKVEKEVKAEKVKKSKDNDSTKVVVPPAPPAPLFTDILPQPLSLEKGDGRFTLNEKSAIICDKGLEGARAYLTQYLPIKRTSGKKSNSIRLVLDNKLGKEEYSLIVDKRGIELRGGDYGGVFNAIQSFLQLLPHAVYTKSLALPVDVAYITVKDAPQHHYRGLLLDVARTFQPVYEVKRVIDFMAYCKLNKLHLHLVDNPAWRIEIKKYPHLAQEGGFRGGDSKLHPIYGRFNEKYGGYYTQDEMRDIVAYAKARNIEIIPEIDMPGHSKALGVIHPAILCDYTPDTSATNGIDTRNVWCVAKEENYALIEDIVKELVEIFPSEYIHIGGDEVKFSLWEPCPNCNKLMAEKGLTSYEQLEQHFINRVSEILGKYNRKAVVWDEAVEGGLLPKSTLVTGWRGVNHCLTTTANGYQTIIMPSSVFYLDKRQSPLERGHRSSKGVSLKTICDFTFENAGFSAEQRNNIAGIEGAFWSEIYLPNINTRGHFSDYIEYMLFPRLFGVAEVAWSKQRRSYDDMMAVLKSNFYHKLQAMSASFRLDPPTIKVENGKIFASADEGVKIYYRDLRTNKREEYKVPLNADLALYTAFYTRLMTGYSNEVGAPAYYETKKPKCKIRSSIEFSETHPLERCAQYKNDARSLRAAKKNDWIEIRFDKPLRCQYLRLATGYEHLRRCLIYNGHIDVCYDGKKFTRVGVLTNGSYILRPKRKQMVHAIRIVADGISDAEERIILQPLEIR